MHFNVKLQFLGLQENMLQDGTKFYKVSMYDPNGGAPVQFNVMGTRTELLEVLGACKFGSTVSCNFALHPKDNLYRLSVVSLEAYK